MDELTLRRQQVTEAFADLEAVFAEPGCFGDCSVVDCAVSLSSEFDFPPTRDPAMVNRLAKLAAAETAGDAKAARRHLLSVRGRMVSRFGELNPTQIPRSLVTTIRQAPRKARSGTQVTNAA